MDNPVVRVLLKGRVLQEVPFSGQTLRIGRMKENDIVVNNLAVSRFHAALVREGDRLVFEDLGSENGSFVNGTRVERDVTVAFGDDIQIGKHQLVILPAQVAAAPPPPQPSRAVSDAWDDNETYVADGSMLTDPGATSPGFQVPSADAPTAPQPVLQAPPAAAAPASPDGSRLTAASVDEAGMDEIDLLLGARSPQPRGSDLAELGGDGADELDALLSGGDLGDLTAAGPGTPSGQDETVVTEPPAPPPAVAAPFEGLEDDDLAGELPCDLTVDDDDLLPSLHTGSTPSVDPNESTAQQSAPVAAAPDLDEQTILTGPPTSGGSVADVALPWEADSNPVPESSPEDVTVLDAAPPELPAPPPVEAPGLGEAAPMATAPAAATELPPVPAPAPVSVAADFDPVLDDGPGESDDASLFDFAVDEDLTALQPAALPQRAAALPQPTAAPSPHAVSADSAPSQPSDSGSDPNAQLPHVGMIIHRSGELEQMVPWDRDVLCAGRADECEIQLGAAEVSRRHALFVREGGAFTVRDLNSINGIFVNGERVDHRALSVGDVVRIEDYELTFLRDRKPLSVPAEPVMTEPATAESEAQGLTMTVLDPAPPERAPAPVPSNPAPAFASPGFAGPAASAASATSDAPTPLPPAFGAVPAATDMPVDVPEMDLFPVPISRPGSDPAPVPVEDPASAPPNAAPEPMAGFAAPQPDAGPAFVPPSFETAPGPDSPAPFDATAAEADHEAPTQPPEMPVLDDEQDFPAPAGTGSFFQSAPGQVPAAPAGPPPEASLPAPPALDVESVAPASAPPVHAQSPETPLAPNLSPPPVEPPMPVQSQAPERLPEPASAPQPTAGFSMSEAGPELPFSLNPAPAPPPVAPAPEADSVLAPSAPEPQRWPAGPPEVPADSFAAPPAAAEEPLTDAPSEVDFAQPVAPVPTLPPFVIPNPPEMPPETPPEPAPPVSALQPSLADPTPPAMTEVDLLAEDEPDEKDLPHADPEAVQQMRTGAVAAEENASPLARAAATVTAQSVSETVAAAVEALPPLRLELKLRTDHLPEPLRGMLDGLLGGELRLPIEIRLSTGAPRLEDKAG